MSAAMTNTCGAFLTASRRVAEKRKGWTDRGCAVLGDDGYFFVETLAGKIVWEGTAHCKYCARAEAITKMGAVAS